MAWEAGATLTREPGRTHALRGAVKVFLIFCRLNAPSCEAGVRYGVCVPGEQRLHRMACGPANTERGCESIGMPRPARRLAAPGPCPVVAGHRLEPRRKAGSMPRPMLCTFAGGTWAIGGASAPRIACHSVPCLGQSRRIFGVHRLRCSVHVVHPRRRGDGGQRRPQPPAKRPTRARQDGPGPAGR
jgi:hypothetical protein